MLKTKTFLSIIILLLVLFKSESAQAQNLVLWHSDGTTTEVELYTQPRVLFEKDKVLVTSPVIYLEYNKNDIIRFTYKGKSTGIISPSLEADFEQKDGQIIFHDIKSANQLAVYKTNGLRVPVHFVIQGKDALLPLSSIPSGVYLFCVNGQTSKFTKK